MYAKISLLENMDPFEDVFPTHQERIENIEIFAFRFQIARHLLGCPAGT